VFGLKFNENEGVIYHHVCRSYPPRSKQNYVIKEYFRMTTNLMKAVLISLMEEIMLLVKFGVGALKPSLHEKHKKRKMNLILV